MNVILAAVDFSSVRRPMLANARGWLRVAAQVEPAVDLPADWFRRHPKACERVGLTAVRATIAPGL